MIKILKSFPVNFQIDASFGDGLFSQQLLKSSDISYGLFTDPLVSTSIKL